MKVKNITKEIREAFLIYKSKTNKKINSRIKENIQDYWQIFKSDMEHVRDTKASVRKIPREL